MGIEWTRYYHEPDWHGLEVLHAHFVEHIYARHAHDYFVIGYVEAGVQTYSYRGGRHVTPAGHVFLVNPGETHTGEAATADGYVYRTMYPRPTLMEQVALDAAGQRTLPFFREAVVRDPKLAGLLAAFHRAIAESHSRLAIELFLTKALAHLIVEHGDARFSGKAVGRERAAVRHAREYMDAHFADEVTLSRLSAIARLSPFHLARAFEKEVRLPPHVYLETARMKRARQLLDRGDRIADVALAVGYADQSHLTHRFKRVLGITPGQYVRGHKCRAVEAGAP